MNPPDTTAQEPEDGETPVGRSLFGKGGEVLTRVRELAQEIVERVNRALGDTEPHSSLPTEEKPALS
jgi:hypothetical protein